MHLMSRVGCRLSVWHLLIGLALITAPVSTAMAATTTVPGAAATIAPLDNFGATVESQLVLTWVKILGVVLVVGGALSMLRVPGLGTIGILAGLLIIFANPIIEATFTATSATPLGVLTAPAMPGTIPVLLRPIVVLAYYPYLLLHVLFRPEVWLAVACYLPFRSARHLV